MVYTTCGKMLGMLDPIASVASQYFEGHEAAQKPTISGWWLTYPSENYDSQLGCLFAANGKIQNVPNHQPDGVLLNLIPPHCIAAN